MNYNWSTDYNVSYLPRPQDPPSVSRWAFDDCAAVPNDSESLIVLSRSTGRKAVVAKAVFEALSECRQFDTHENHLARLHRNYPSLQRGDLEQAINGLKSARLIVTEPEVFRRLAVHKGVAAPAGSPLVAISTCDRPHLLERLLTSAGRNQQRSGEGYRYLILDDSRDPGRRQENRRQVEKAAASLGLDASYHGPEENSRWLSRIKEQAPDLAGAAEFLLEGAPDWTEPTHGRNWNRALLLSAGQPLVTVDDDVLLEYCLPPDGQSEEITLGSPMPEAWFFATDNGWRDLAAQEKKDPIAELVNALGSPLGALVQPAIDKGKAALEAVDPEDLRTLGGDANVLVAGCGYAGDPGTGSNAWLYELQGESRLRLTQSEANYRRFKYERNLWHGYRRTVLSPRYSLISGLKAVDNRACLPPLFPLLRNEDFLFGTMTQLLHPDSLLLQKGFAVPHLPDSRHWKADAAAQAVQMGALRFITMWLDRGRSGLAAAPFESRLDALKASLRELASQDVQRLQILLDEALLEFRSAKIQFRREDLAEWPEGPEYWRRDMELSIQCNTEAMHRQQTEYLGDMPDRDGPGSGLARFKRLLGEYTDALGHWERLRELASPLARG